MASAVTFGDANSGFQAGIINGPVNAQLHIPLGKWQGLYATGANGGPPPERPETPPNPSAVLPFARDRDFVERGGLLDRIHQECAVAGSRTALVGLGGVG